MKVNRFGMTQPVFIEMVLTYAKKLCTEASEKNCLQKLEEAKNLLERSFIQPNKKAEELLKWIDYIGPMIKPISSEQFQSLQEEEQLVAS
jgi:hypothetical protein